MSFNFATVNMERVLSETREGKRIIEDIRAREEPKKQEYQKMVNEIVEMRNRFQAMGKTMKPEDALKMRQQVEQKELTALRFQETTLRELENYRLETMAHFEKAVFPVIDKISQGKKLTFLFPYPQRWVIYADPSIDITDVVIQEIDKSVIPKPPKNSPGGGKPGGGGPKLRGVAGGLGNRPPKGNVKV